MRSQQELRSKIRALRRERAASSAANPAPTTNPRGQGSHPAIAPSVIVTGGGGTSGAGNAEPEIASGTSSMIEQTLDELSASVRLESAAYLKRVGMRSLWGSLGLVFVLGVVLVVTRGWLPADDCEGAHCAQHHQAWISAAALWLIVAVLSWLKQADGGVITMLVGRDGRFSTSYFQAWIWTLVICWTFGFFVADAVFRRAADLGVVGNQVDADYFLLLGGPFAALVVAQQIKNAKLSSGEVQQVASSGANVKDVVSSDDGRTDLVDTQYLLFNFVALATFAAMFLRTPTNLPDLPDGLVLLTSGAALTYIGNKAVERNRPGITSVVLETGAGTPTVGDIVRINGFNFVPSGAELEEYLTRVRVRFGGSETPVDPPASEGGGSSTGGATGRITGNQVLTLYADNVTASALRVAIPRIPGLPENGRQVEVVVVTAGGAETAAFPLWVLPKP